MTDPHQELVELLRQLACILHDEDHERTGLADECLRLAERIAEANRWIPVSERLPELPTSGPLEWLKSPWVPVLQFGNATPRMARLTMSGWENDRGEPLARVWRWFELPVAALRPPPAPAPSEESEPPTAGGKGTT